MNLFKKPEAIFLKKTDRGFTQVHKQKYNENDNEISYGEFTYIIPHDNATFWYKNKPKLFYIVNNPMPIFVSDKHFVNANLGEKLYLLSQKKVVEQLVKASASATQFSLIFVIIFVVLATIAGFALGYALHSPTAEQIVSNSTLVPTPTPPAIFP